MNVFNELIFFPVPISPRNRFILQLQGTLPKSLRSPDQLEQGSVTLSRAGAQPGRFQTATSLPHWNAAVGGVSVAHRLLQSSGVDTFQI